MSTFVQLYSEVGNLTPSTGVTRDKYFVNQAYHWALSQRRWSFLETNGTVTLVAGTRDYALSGATMLDCDGAYDVTMVLTAGAATVRLPYCTPQMHSRLFSHCFTQSQPSLWTSTGSAIAATSGAVVSGNAPFLRLNYPPVAVAGSGVSLIVKYWRSAASIEMTADADVPLFPVQYHNLIASKAIAIAMNRYGLTSDAVGHEKDYQEQVQAADIADAANRFADFEQVEFRTLPQLDNRIGFNPVTSSPNVPYPQSQS